MGNSSPMIHLSMFCSVELGLQRSPETLLRWPNFKPCFRSVGMNNVLRIKGSVNKNDMLNEKVRQNSIISLLFITVVTLKTT